MICCNLLEEGIERGAFYFGERQRVDDGRFVNELDTDYFVRSATSRGYDYTASTTVPSAAGRFRAASG